MLKTYAATYVSLQENLTSSEKLSIIRWIEEADEDSIKSLLVTGRYEVQQEAVQLFEDTMGQLLDEIDLGSAFKGFASADGKMFTGIVDVQQLNQLIQQAVNQGTQSGAIAGLGAGAVAALVLVVAGRAYKRFFSKAARACRHLGSVDKTGCMNKFKRQGMIKKIDDLQTGMQSCQHTKKPEKCQAKIEEKIKKLRAKLGDV